MIKYIILTIILLLSFNLSAQETKLKYGLKAGINYAIFTPNIDFSEFDELDYSGKVGFYLGGYLNYELFKFLKIQPEILFSSQGSKTIRKTMVVPQLYLEAKTRITESTLAIPVLLQLYPFKNFYIEAGPQFGYVISRNEKVTEEMFTDYTGTFELQENCPYCDETSLGAAYGFGFSISNRIGINMRYFEGFQENDETIRPIVVYLGGSYRF